MELLSLSFLSVDLLVTANDALHISCHRLPASLHIAVAREREQTEIASRNSRPVSMGFFSHSLLHLHYMKLHAIDRHAAGSVYACIFLHHDSYKCSSLIPLSIIGSVVVAVKTQLIRLLCHFFSQQTAGAPGNSPWDLIYVPLLSSVMTLFIHFILSSLSFFRVMFSFLFFPRWLYERDACGHVCVHVLLVRWYKRAFASFLSARASHCTLFLLIFYWIWHFCTSPFFSFFPSFHFRHSWITHRIISL